MISQRSQYVEALLLDINILFLVIERNRKQHFRASYFRRLDMLVRAIKRYNIVKIDPNSEESKSLPEVMEAVRDAHDRIASLLERHKGVHKRRGTHSSKIEEEQWSISSTTEQNCDDSAFIKDLKVLHAALTVHLPEIISRITYAASALYTELSRGYFAPLCTVALACISRIRVLVLRMGRDIHSILQRTIGWLENDFSSIVSKGGNLEKQTLLTLQSVNNFLNGYQMEPNLLNSFIDVDYKDHLEEMNKRKLHKVLQRGESSGSSTPERKHDCENLADEGSNNETLESIEDIVGELVDTSADIMTNGDQINDAAVIPEKESGDRNLQIVALLKEKNKMKKPKKRKIDDDIFERQENRAKAKKVAREAAKQKNTDVKESSKKKAKDKKKKKKKRSKDVIDSIFDGF